MDYYVPSTHHQRYGSLMKRYVWDYFGIYDYQKHNWIHQFSIFSFEAQFRPLLRCLFNVVYRLNPPPPPNPPPPNTHPKHTHQNKTKNENKSDDIGNAGNIEIVIAKHLLQVIDCYFSWCHVCWCVVTFAICTLDKTCFIESIRYCILTRTIVNIAMNKCNIRTVGHHSLRTCV